MRACVVAALALLAASASAEEGPKISRRKVLSADGAALALYRYSPDGGGAGRPAVLLVPDLGFGRECFDLQGEGLAPFLQRRGLDTFVAELRGQGNADAPAAWALSEWATLDLRAVVDAVQAVHPGPLDLVVHGYGGGLAIAAAPRELQGKVRRVVALSPAVAPEVPNPVVRRLLGLPGTLSRAAQERAFDLLFAHGAAMGGATRGLLERSGPRDLGQSAARDLLRWMEEGDLPFPDGTRVRERIAGYDRPTLVVLPMLDNYAHAEFAEPLRALAPRARVQLRSLSKLYMEREDYTHLSMLHGRGAPQDVFAPALAFLDAPEEARP
ncbi:MAG TPA: alpha/beta fold hydrolase [Myxococcales bacterium]|nr:alpha/beta fold hydrolase [Myxococcales bacterium]